MVICLERGADLHMAQLTPLPITVSCSSKIQIGFTFLVPAYPGYVILEKRPLNGCCCSGTTRVSWYQKGKPIWILLKQETVSGSGISMSAPCSRQTTTPTPYHSVFYRLDALSDAQPTVLNKLWASSAHLYMCR